MKEKEQDIEYGIKKALNITLNFLIVTNSCKPLYKILPIIFLKKFTEKCIDCNGFLEHEKVEINYWYTVV